MCSFRTQLCRDVFSLKSDIDLEKISKLLKIMCNEEMGCVKQLLIFNRWLHIYILSGVYILENTPPPQGGEKYQTMSFGGKIWKGQEKKAENVEEKGRKGK